MTPESRAEAAKLLLDIYDRVSELAALIEADAPPEEPVASDDPNLCQHPNEPWSLPASTQMCKDCGAQWTLT